MAASVALAPLAEKGRALYKWDALSVKVNGSRRCEVVDPTGEHYSVDTLAGPMRGACECVDYMRQQDCAHVGAVQAYFEQVIEELEEVYRQ